MPGKTVENSVEVPFVTAVTIASAATRDPRLGDAVDVSVAGRSDEARRLNRAYPVETWFRIEAAGQATARPCGQTRQRTVPLLSVST